MVPSCENDYVLKRQILIKQIIEPYVYQAIHAFNNVYISEGYMVMSSGGGALQAYFPNVPEIISHDFDLKMVSCGKRFLKEWRENHSTMVERIRLGQIFMNEVERVLNEGIGRWISIQPNSGLVLIKGQQTFKVLRDNEQLFTLRYMIKDCFDSVVDMFIPDLENVDSLNVFVSGKNRDMLTAITMDERVMRDRILNRARQQNDPVTYLPYTFVGSVPTVALGALIYDIMRMIRERPDKKLRNKKKLWAVIDALNNPAYNMSCNPLNSFINKCIQQENVNTDQIIDQAVAQNYLPDDPVFIQNLKSLGVPIYIDEYVRSMTEKKIRD